MTISDFVSELLCARFGVFGFANCGYNSDSVDTGFENSIDVVKINSTDRDDWAGRIARFQTVDNFLKSLEADRRTWVVFAAG